MKWKVLLLCHLLIAILLSTFLWPVTRSYWDELDRLFFHLLNDPLREHRWLQAFWGLSNHKLADWLEDLCILGFFIAYIRSPTKTARSRKISEFIFCILYTSLIIFFINRVLFREMIEVYRESPTLAIEGSIRLSKELSWLTVKDLSYKSFPADHATTALLFAVSFSYFVGRRFGIPAFLYAIFLCLPRMAVGAHWLSDVLIGSCTLVLFFLSWGFCTPFHTWVIDGIERIFFLARKKKRAV